MQLTEHFSLAELCVTDTGLDNTPNAAQQAKLQTLAEFLEKVRHVLGDHPMQINSAHRSPAVNARVGGVPTSAHAEDEAADFTCDMYGSTYRCAKALAEAGSAGVIVFDQLIYEGPWVHISRDPRARGQRLTYVNGDYIEGIVGP